MVRWSTFVRPQRSASDASGNAAKDARRSAARPRPNFEPESPTTLCSVLVEEKCPKCLATSFSDEMAPNWANPATSAMRNSTTVTRTATGEGGTGESPSAKLNRVIHHDECLAVI